MVLELGDKMKEIETNNYKKYAGKTERGKRDGTGPFEGRRKMDQKKDKKKDRKKLHKDDGSGCPFMKENKDD